MPGKSVISVIAVAFLAILAARAEEEAAPAGTTEIAISVAEQKLVLLRDGMRLAQYKISTSKFGAGDSYGSYKTPLGKLRVCEKVGEALPCGAVIKHRSATGEILPVNAPGRDPIVTRIIWLDGLEEQNKNAKSRGIYIHGTVEEAKIGSPVSYGCIRMRSREVMELFEQAPIGTVVTIQADKLPKYQRWTAPPPVIIAAAKTPPPAKPVSKPVAEPVAAKPAATLLASQPAPAKPAATLLASQPVQADADEDSPRVTLSESARKKRFAADPGAADALKGSILFADLPAHTAPTRTAPARPALEPVAEILHSDPAPVDAPQPRVSFRTNASGTIAQKLP